MSIDRKHYGWIAAAVVVMLLVIDQVIKIEVKTGMALGEAIRVTDWFYIDFVENNGMAYGMTFINKVVLSLFRLVAITAIGWLLCRIVRRKLFSLGFVLCLSVILAGAAGNLIDCMFYGLLFEESTYCHVAGFTGFGNGYAPFLYGKVVDMFYFPIIRTTWPEWVPVWGGTDYVFFSPVFNFADSCISVGVVMLVLFFRREMELISQAWK